MQGGQELLKASVTQIAVAMKQDNLGQKLTEVVDRLTCLEEKAFVIDTLQSDLLATQESIDTFRKECTKLHACLDDAEDKSRCNNLIFYNIPKAPQETPTDVEQKLVSLLSDLPIFSLRHDSIERAHRLGHAAENSCRPIIAKFVAYKTKYFILSSRTTLK